MIQQELSQFLCHSLGQGRNQYSLVSVRSGQYLIQQIVYLIFTWSYFYFRIQQSGRSNQLFYHNALSLLEFIVGRCGTYVDRLMDHTVEFFKGQRSVVKSSRKSKTVFHEILLSGSITSVHRTYLWDADMTLIYHKQEIFREEVQQTVWSFSSLSSIEISGVVFDTRTVT